VPGTSPLTLSFPLSSIVGGGSRTTGLTKTIKEVEGVRPETSLVGWALLNGQHASQLFISDSF